MLSLSLSLFSIIDKLPRVPSRSCHQSSLTFKACSLLVIIARITAGPPERTDAFSPVLFQGSNVHPLHVPSYRHPHERRDDLRCPARPLEWLGRRLGIGGDGVIFALPGKEGLDYSMRIINSDGSEVSLHYRGNDFSASPRAGHRAGCVPCPLHRLTPARKQWRGLLLVHLLFEVRDRQRPLGTFVWRPPVPQDSSDYRTFRCPPYPPANLPQSLCPIFLE